MDNIHNIPFTKIIDNVLGAEGPVFTADGKFFMVAPEVEVNKEPAGQILEVNLVQNQSKMVCAPIIDGYGGIPAGLQSDKENNLWIADMRLGLIKLSADRKLTQVARVDSDNCVMQGCNDCIFDYQGNLWFTAPAGDIAPAPYRRSTMEAFGSVYCLKTTGEVVKLDSGFLFSNGIAVQHSNSGKPLLLIVAETGTKTLWAYDISAPAKIANKRKWAKVPGNHEGGPDGMDFDEEGNLLVANWGSSYIEIFSASGEHRGRIRCPFEKISNVHFKPNSNELFVTEHNNHAVWKTIWKCKGKKQFCEL